MHFSSHNEFPLHGMFSHDQYKNPVFPHTGTGHKINTHLKYACEYDYLFMGLFILLIVTKYPYIYYVKTFIQIPKNNIIYKGSLLGSRHSINTAFCCVLNSIPTIVN